MARSGRSSGVVWNLLTVLILVGAVCVLSLFLMIFINPQSALNPFPPPTVPVLMVLPTASPTSANQLPPTWTPTSVQLPTETPTPEPTNTPTVTATFYVLPSPTITPTPTATKPPEFLLSGGVQYDRAGPTTGRGCDWMGVGGNVVDLDGNPVQGLTVLLGGEYETKAVNKTTLTGTNLDYGEGGYEFTIADDPGPSKETLYVQLFTPDGKTVSPQYFFRTYDDCKQNLIRLDFQQSQ
jgi:hypothetical protein